MSTFKAACLCASSVATSSTTYVGLRNSWNNSVPISRSSSLIPCAAESSRLHISRSSSTLSSARYARFVLIFGFTMFSSVNSSLSVAFRMVRSCCMLISGETEDAIACSVFSSKADCHSCVLVGISEYPFSINVDLALVLTELSSLKNSFKPELRSAISSWSTM